MPTAEDYANWIVNNEDKKGTEEFNTVAEAYKLSLGQVEKPVEPPKTERTLKEVGLDVAGPLIKGLGGVAALPSQLGQLAGYEGLPLQETSKKIQDYGESLKSETYKQKEKNVNALIQEAEDKGILEQAIVAFKETGKDPALFAGFLAEMLPNFIPGMAIGRGLKIAGAGAKTALGATLGTNAVMQGADVGSQTYEDTYKYLLSKGVSDPEAKQEALNIARQVAVGAGGVSLGAQFLPGARSLEKSLLGIKGTSGRLASAVGTGLGEAGSEVVEEAGGKLLGNYGMQQVNPEQSLTEGLGQTIGMAALGGFGLGTVGGALRGKVATPEELSKDQALDNVLSDLRTSFGTSDAISQPDLIKKMESYGLNSREAENFILNQSQAGNLNMVVKDELPYYQIPEANFEEKKQEAVQAPESYNPEFVQAAAELNKTLLPQLNKFGLKNVGLNILDSIEGGKADGYYANKIIGVALNADNPMGVLRHESIHALRAFDAFKPQEWNVLENKAKSEWVDTFIKKKDLYNSYKEQYLQDKGSLEGFDDYIHEEAIAEAFKHFDKNGAPPGAIGNIYYRLKQLFETLRNGFTGIGFDTTDKIFNRVEQGKMAPQEVGTTDTKYALKPPETPEFEEFFKDSKVRDEENKPQLVYHASKNFEGNEFKPSKKVNRTGNPDGYYFTHDLEDANDYAGNEEGSQIIPAYLDIKNPYNYGGRNKHNPAMVKKFEQELRQDNPNLGDNWIKEKVNTFKEGRFPNISFPTDAMTRVIQAGGYDGMKDGRDWVAFEPNQIKSAFNQKPTESNDIRYSLKLEDVKKQLAPNAFKTNNFKATPFAKKLAKDYKEENDIAPYLSEGQIPVMATPVKYSLKLEGKYGEDPSTGLPLNKNGTVTLYHPTTSDEARRINVEKKLFAQDPNESRIYLTNESSGWKAMGGMGNMNQKTDGSVVRVEVDPNVLQIDQEYENGRKDFFIPVKEGDYFNKKMRLWAMYASRNQAIPSATRYQELGQNIEKGISDYESLSPADKKIRLKEVRTILRKEHNIGKLLGENGKLEKTRVGDYGLKYDDQSVASLGLGLASAQRLNEKTSTCPVSAICEGLCLGDTSGNNQMYGGMAKEGYVKEGDQTSFRAGPRLSQYLKTEAMMVHPEEFAVLLHEEIKSFERWAVKNDYKPTVRLNVTSDIPPKYFKSIIDAHPNVMFYDYTKLDSSTVAPNHHLTYSSTGVSQVVNGEKIVNTESNWERMKKVLSRGDNVAMAFTSKTDMPEFVKDEASGKTYKVWDGDNYDARFLDPKQESGEGMIVGLTNKASTLKSQTAAKETKGFFIDYDKKRDGNTAIIKDQSAINKKVIPISAKFSLKAPNTPKFKRWFGSSKIVNPDGSPKVMYHGTAQDIETFKPKQANAIFVTDNPKFAEIFGESSEVYMANKAMMGELPKEKLQELVKKSEKIAKKNDTDESDELSELVKNELPTRANIMPLFIKAENPFDYANSEQLDALVQELNKKTYADGKPVGDDLKRYIKAGSWTEIEKPIVQKAIQALGHDGFYVFEGGQKNLAVYDPSQLKSATGNRGTFDITSPNIRYALPSPLKKLTKLEESKSSYEATTDAMQTAFKQVQSNEFWTSVRGNLVDPAAWLTKSLSTARKVNGKNVEGLDRFDVKGQLRADMLVRINSQMGNFVKNGMLSGVPTLNKDGGLMIERTESNLARALYLADKLDSNPNVKALGISGRFLAAEVGRIKRGEEILKEDARSRAEGKSKSAEAIVAMKEARKLYKQGKIREANAEVKKARSLRKEAFKLKKQNRELQVTPEHIAWANKQLVKVPELNQIFNVWNDVNNSLVDFWQEVGLLDENKANEYRSNKSYLPLYKSLEELNEEGFFSGTGTGLKSTKSIKHLKGSESIRNIWENMDRHYASMTSMGFQNQIRKVAVEQLEGLGLARITKNNDPDANLRYKEDGKVVSAIVDNPNDLTAFEMMHFELSPLANIFSGSTKVLRAGALINPYYWFKQLIVDPIHATFVTNAGVVTPFHSMKAFAEILIGKSKDAEMLASRGVGGSVDSLMDIHEFMKQSGRERVDQSFIKKPISAIMRIHEASDSATRVAIFRKALKTAKKKDFKGEDAINFAVHTSREAINFSVHGKSRLVTEARHMIPFFSSTINSLDTVYRAASGAGLNKKEAAEARRIFYGSAMATTMMAVVYAMSLAGDPEYEDLTDQEKYNNLLISNPLGKGFIKLPIPYELGFLFKVIPEASFRTIYGTSTGKEWATAMQVGILQNIPSGGIPVPQAIKPVLENYTNKSFHTGYPIEGMGDQGLPVKMRGERASEFSKLLSNAGLDKIGLSPANIDNIAKGYFANLGMYALDLMDQAIFAIEGKTPPARELESIPIIKRFMTDPNVSKAVQDFYKLEHNARETMNEFNRYKDTGNVEMIQELVNDPERLANIGGASSLRDLGKGLGEINKAIRYYQDNEESGTPQERRERINELKQIKKEIAKAGYGIAKGTGMNR